MDKSRFKRPPDVDEALSSMLWTPYDQMANASSSSSDSLSDDERQREKKKLNRLSNPLPHSMNWWNSQFASIHPASLRYSFPFYGNILPALVASTTTNNLDAHASQAATSDIREQAMEVTLKKFRSSSHAPTSIDKMPKDNFHSHQHSNNSQMACNKSQTLRTVDASHPAVAACDRKKKEDDKTGNSAASFVRHATRVTQPRVCSKYPKTLCAQHSNTLQWQLSEGSTKQLSHTSTSRGSTCSDSQSELSVARSTLPGAMNGTDTCRNTARALGGDRHYPQMPSASPQKPVQIQFLDTAFSVSLTNSHSVAASDDVPCTSSVIQLPNDSGRSQNALKNGRLNDAIVNECQKNLSKISANESSESGPADPANCSENGLMITCAIESEKELREKRRRERRDRRLARSRTVNGSEMEGNLRPPPYSSLPPTHSSSSSSIIPSIISTVPVDDTVRYMFSLPLVRRSTTDRSGKDCCGQWFNGPPLRFLVALVALGGVACTLGGATLGSIALAGSPASHLTAGLLMTGVGIVLVTISGVAWRMTTSDAHQCTGRCGRRQCSRGNSSFGLLYPEFQHRPPPPSYQASMQEHRIRVMMLDGERQTPSSARASPPPTYRSNTGTLLRPPTQFQRQHQLPQQDSSINNNNRDIMQIEIPIHEPTTVSDVCNSSGSVVTTDCFLPTHSATSSQTITTIASINRPAEDDAVDVATLNKINETLMTETGVWLCRDDETNGENRCKVTFSNYVSGSNSSNISSSRCTSCSDKRNTLCNNETLDHQHHGASRHRMINTEGIRATEDRCKNVYIGNTMDINKAPTSSISLATMTLPRCTQPHRSICEMGVSLKAPSFTPVVANLCAAAPQRAGLGCREKPEKTP